MEHQKKGDRGCGRMEGVEGSGSLICQRKFRKATSKIYIYTCISVYVRHIWAREKNPYSSFHLVFQSQVYDFGV